MNYKQNESNNTFTLIFNNNIEIIIDNNQFLKFINNKKCWKIEEQSTYPYYKYNNKKINILQFLFIYKPVNIYYTFKDKNKYNLQENNVNIYHFYNKIIEKKYKIKQYINGHYEKIGSSAYVMKNPIWIIDDNLYLMYCDKNTITTLCEKSYKKILDFEKNNKCKLTWHRTPSGYINGNPIKLYIHQVILELFYQGQGTKNLSVDHIDRNPLNNIYDNLKIATMKEQQKNTKGIIKGTKRRRKKNAKQLPDGLTHDMLPKYVVYYKERRYLKGRTKDNDEYREYFKIEKHPNLIPNKSGKKIWISPKRKNLTIFEKLDIVKEKLREIELQHT